MNSEHEIAEPEAPESPDAILGWLAALLDPGQRVELRAFGIEGKRKGERGETESRVYEPGQRRALVDHALALSGRAEGVYFVLNPIMEDAKGSARDAGIARRRLLLIDTDPERDPAAKLAAGDGAKLSATDAEKRRAGEMSGAIREYLDRLHWPSPVVADSGNGSHLVYPIDLPNDEASRTLIRNVLRALAYRFDTAEATVDTSVFNASRITKFYGTVARKGEPTAERPHRASRVLEIPDGFSTRPVFREQLEALAAMAPPSGVTAGPSGPGPEADGRHDSAGSVAPGLYPTRERGGRADDGRWTPEARAWKYLESVDLAVSGEHGHNQTLKAACKAGPGFDLHPATTLGLLREWNKDCRPPWPDKDLARKVDEAYKVESRRGWLLNAPRKGSVPLPARNGHTMDGRAAGPPDPGSSEPPNGRGDHPQDADADLPVNEAPDDPHRLARAVLAEFAHLDGPTLAWYRETFYDWDGTAYLEDPDLNSRIVTLVKAEVDRQNRAALRAFDEQAERQVLAPSLGRPSRPPVVPKVTRRLIADVLQALASMTGIAGRDAAAPFWIRPRADNPPPAGLVAAGQWPRRSRCRGWAGLAAPHPSVLLDVRVALPLRPGRPRALGLAQVPRRPLGGGPGERPRAAKVVRLRADPGHDPPEDPPADRSAWQRTEHNQGDPLGRRRHS